MAKQAIFPRVLYRLYKEGTCGDNIGTIGSPRVFWPSEVVLRLKNQIISPQMCVHLKFIFPFL